MGGQESHSAGQEPDTLAAQTVDRGGVVKRGGRAQEATTLYAGAQSWEPGEFRATFSRTVREPLGIRCVVSPVDRKLVLAAVKEGGTASLWNKGNTSQALCPGDIFVEVNGQRLLHDMVNELNRDGCIDCVLRRGTQASLDEISSSKNHWVMPALVRAADVEFSRDFCSICHESVGTEEGLVKLECGHGFHAGCLTQYVLRSTRTVCPLCNRSLA